MAAPKGNRFWEARTTYGRDKLFSTPSALWDACCEYFQWVENNPLTKAIVYQGAVTDTESLMRAMTIEGLCIFLDVDLQTLINYGSKAGYEDYFDVVNKIKSIIRTQKFEGASAGLLNPNIIARDLGLADKKEVNGDLLNPLTELIKEISGNTLGPSSSD